MNWPDDVDEVGELSGAQWDYLRARAIRADIFELQRANNSLVSMINDRVWPLTEFDPECPKGIIWLRGITICRLDPRSHDAHVGAVGGE